MSNQNIVFNVARAIAASAFLSVAVMLPQAGFSQQSPGAAGDPRVDEPNTNTRINDPSRPINEQENTTSGPNAGQNGNTSTPNSQMNNSGFGSGSGAGGTGVDRSNPDQPANRVERYTQPGATDPNQTTDYVPPAAGNSQNRGNDVYTSPNSAPGRGTYTSPRSQTDNNMNTGGGAGGVGGSIDNRINNSTSPGSATPGTGSTNYNNNDQLNTPSGTNNNNNRTNYDTNTNTGGGAGGAGSGAVPGLW